MFFVCFLSLSRMLEVC